MVASTRVLRRAESSGVPGSESGGETSTIGGHYNPVLIIFGNEVEGVSEEVLACCDACIEIPQFGMKHSLNVSVAAGMVLWELVRSIQKFNTAG